MIGPSKGTQQFRTKYRPDRRPERMDENESMALTAVEHARIIEYLRALGLTEKQINDLFIYVATGSNLPIK